jgi:hypothetical protein
MKPHPTVKALLVEIDEFCRKSGTSRTGFGRRVAGDSHLVSRLRGGSMPTLMTIERIQRYIRTVTKEQQRIWRD